MRVRRSKSEKCTCCVDDNKSNKTDDNSDTKVSIRALKFLCSNNNKVVLLIGDSDGYIYAVDIINKHI